MEDIHYRGYIITEGGTMFSPYIFYPEGHYELQGHGENLEECKKSIDELIEMAEE
jgi:hypothetical protein